MTDLAPFPDVEAAVLEVVADLVADTSKGTVTPSDLQTRLPYIRVTRIGGTDDRFTDTARVDVDVFDANRATAVPLAESVRQRLISGPHVTTSAVIDRVATISAPAEIPWGDPEVRRWIATYQVACRRSPTT